MHAEQANANDQPILPAENAAKPSGLKPNRVKPGSLAKRPALQCFVYLYIHRAEVRHDGDAGSVSANAVVLRGQIESGAQGGHQLVNFCQRCDKGRRHNHCVTGLSDHQPMLICLVTAVNRAR